MLLRCAVNLHNSLFNFEAMQNYFPVNESLQLGEELLTHCGDAGIFGTIVIGHGIDVARTGIDISVSHVMWINRRRFVSLFRWTTWNVEDNWFVEKLIVFINQETCLYSSSLHLYTCHMLK